MALDLAFELHSGYDIINCKSDVSKQGGKSHWQTIVQIQWGVADLEEEHTHINCSAQRISVR